MAPTKLLLTGATGYIGGTVLTQLLNSTNQHIKALRISVLIRKEQQAEVFTSNGVTPILFKGLEATEDLRRIANDHEIVIHAADSTSPAAAEALILGLADCRENSNLKYFLHVSGTSSLGDRPITMETIESREFSDKDDIYSYLKERETVATYAQRATDIKTVSTGELTGVNTLIVKAPIIYGRGTGIFNQKSFHIPALIQGAVAAGQAEYIGDGNGKWDYIHVIDLAGLFELLVSRILNGEGVSTGRNGIYFAEMHRRKWKSLAEGIAIAGYSIGRLSSPVPRSITLREAAEKYTRGDQVLAEIGLASNSLTSAQRSRELGWKPNVDMDFQKSILDDFNLLFNTERVGTMPT